MIVALALVSYSGPYWLARIPKDIMVDGLFVVCSGLRSSREGSRVVSLVSNRELDCFDSPRNPESDPLGAGVKKKRKTVDCHRSSRFTALLLLLTEQDYKIHTSYY